MHAIGQAESPPRARDGLNEAESAAGQRFSGIAASVWRL